VTVEYVACSVLLCSSLRAGPELYVYRPSASGTGTASCVQVTLRVPGVLHHAALLLLTSVDSSSSAVSGVLCFCWLRGLQRWYADGGVFADVLRRWRAGVAPVCSSSGLCVHAW
jgi:hypothetical protein